MPGQGFKVLAIEQLGRWFKAGILPVPAKQLPNGTILLSDAGLDKGSVIIYARASSFDQKADLDAQVSRLLQADKVLLLLSL